MRILCLLRFVVALGSSHLKGTSLEAENVNEHYKHAVADEHAVACHALVQNCVTRGQRCNAPAGTRRLFGAQRLLAIPPSLHPAYKRGRHLFEGGFYSRKYGTSHQGIPCWTPTVVQNTVHVLHKQTCRLEFIIWNRCARLYQTMYDQR